jgi:hypothetical protein
MGIAEFITDRSKAGPVGILRSGTCDLASCDGFREELNPSYRLERVMIAAHPTAAWFETRGVAALLTMRI